MNNPTKTIILLLILGAVALLMSWCSNFDTMTDQKIKELEAEKQKAQMACDQVIVYQGKINWLKQYNGTYTTGTVKKEEKPVAPVTWAYICLNSDDTTFYKEYDNSTMEYLKNCWAFAWRNDCRIATDWTNCLKKE